MKHMHTVVLPIPAPQIPFVYQDVYCFSTGLGPTHGLPLRNESKPCLQWFGCFELKTAQYVPFYFQLQNYN